MAGSELAVSPDGDSGPAPVPEAAVALLAVLLAGAVLFLDAITPLGYGAGFFFMVPFLVVVFGLPRVPPLAAAVVFSLLSAAGFLLSPPGIPPVVAFAGRLAFWALLGGIAVFVDRYLRESRERRGLDERYRALFWRHYTAVLVVDPADGRIVDANPAAARFYGHEREALRAMRIQDLNRAPPGVVAARMREAVEGQQEPFLSVHRLASGEEREVEVFSGPVVSAGRTLLYSIVHDVTGARRAEAAVRASEARYRSLVDELQEGMVLYGVVPGPDGGVADFRILDLNPANERMFARRRDEAVGKTLGELYPGPRPVWLDDLARVAVSGEPAVIPDFDRGDGRRFEVRFYRPAPGHVAGLYIDATERLQAADELRASNAELERFAHVASHDLREPLRTIVSFAELLRLRYGDRLDADASEFLGFIVAGGQRMERLIEALLRDARIGAGPLALEPVDLAAAFAAVEASLADQLAGAGAEVAHGPLPVVLADRPLLELVLANLLGNAVKFRGAEPPQVRVGAAREGDLWRISVADNGVGVPPEMRDAVFEPFRRLHASAAYEGHGIGLATVKRIVGRHGGTVRVDSGPDGGAVFSFTLPAAPGP